MHAAELDPLTPAIPPGQDELPYDDGEPMESPKQRRQRTLLIDTLERRYAGREDVFIGGNMALYFSTLQARNNDFRGPDFFVVLDAPVGRERKSWVVWEEDSRTPDVVIKLLSPSTEREDRGRKMRAYAGMKVTEYYLYDPDSEKLEAFQLVNGGYVPVPAAPDGSCACRVLDLSLEVVRCEYVGQTAGWLRWRDRSGALLPTGDEHAATESARADQETARAAQERARAEAAEARASRLAARLLALGLDPEG